MPREADLLCLEQGEMSVATYASRFKYLARFYTQVVSKVWKCIKVEYNLRLELKSVVAPMCVQEFPALLKKARSVEGLEGPF